MTPEESRFVEEMGRFLGAYGMPPMSGRMWAWLLIGVPREQTAAELAEALHASRGAISGAARILETAGLIVRTSRPGDRREFFSAPADGFSSLLASAGAAYRRLREIAERGLAATSHRPPESRERLEEFRDVMAFVEVALPSTIEQFLVDRAAARERLAG